MLQLPSHLFKFHTKAMLDVLPTEANLFRMKIKKSLGHCQLCHRYETLAHILNNCQPCLDKYKWRHDSVLKVIANFCLEHLLPNCEMYVDLAPSEHWCAMGGAPPAHLLQTSQRPDLIVSNVTERTLAIVELTIPSEQNAKDAQICKTVKYAELVVQAEMNGWNVVFSTIEICSRGTIPMHNLSDAMNKLKRGKLLSFSRAQCQQMLHMSGRTALLASYWIWSSCTSAYILETQPLLC